MKKVVASVALYEIPVTQARAEALVDRTPDALQAYLVGRGLTIDGISVSLNPPVVRIESDLDPTPYLAQATWPTKRDLTAGRATMKAFVAKVNAGQAPTNQEVVQAIKAIIEELARG